MGCDIHGWIEKKMPNGRWVAYSELKDDGRNYERFAKLAGVRGDGPEPEGLPDDISETTRVHVDEDGSDGHSHSHMDLLDAFPIFKATVEKPEYYTWYEAFGVSEEPKECPTCHQHVDGRGKWRLVFWFDN